MKIDQNLVAFITGASSGFGLEVAKDLLEKGCKCYLTDRDNIDPKFLASYPKDRVVFRNLDVTDEEGIKKAIEDCAIQFGHIDAVLNSAGVNIPAYLSIIDEKFSPTHVNKCFNINVVGTFNVSKYAALQMVKQQNQAQQKKDYVIVNVGSVASFNSNNGMSIYGASKGAVAAMTLPMSRDLGRYGIRVVCMCPGVFDTPMGKSAPERLYKATAKGTCLGRHGHPSEFSNAFQGILESTFMNGNHFFLDSSFATPSL
ncbi:short chain dehydrogenase reductase family protein, putative (macronuclear) [Tetrahymena thermophila SB210]|uniref:Short chain dehydrogenase reductase family protein, putative n=1 Tax=Tetrahymena thermophila (strain SB210) TaxID=312017 RepID=Q236S0_TETTS|nr:short chain dehydrogenase reductase family protein, putative [Tetrahymena thermophila SB210]EAR92430.1 short chain dehydrogenase reductase family protein, putative [Tetrahymena thermophila SB210]|eukprot:XP_001012675.1 short chain dehydrogenase reductase family protein, putative [Tetrahymena thermophila SB210]